MYEGDPWVYDKYPTTEETILIRDMFTGYEVGYFDTGFQEFFSKSGENLNNVVAWKYIHPGTPEFHTVKQRVQSQSNVHKGTKKETLAN